MEQEQTKDKPKKKSRRRLHNNIRLGVYAISGILLLAFVIRGVILPVSRGGSRFDKTVGTVAPINTTTSGGLGGSASIFGDAASLAADPVSAFGTVSVPVTASTTAAASTPTPASTANNLGGQLVPVSTGTTYSYDRTTPERESIYAIRVPLKGVTDTEKMAVQSTGWHIDSRGKWYQNADGTYYADGFQEVDGKQYSFDADGYVETGWITSGVHELYFDDTGAYDPDMKRPMIALTYDDGPGIFTDELLEVLKANNAHATFFMLGPRVEEYPEQVRHIVQAGCELGNHSWKHTDALTTIYLEDAIQEFVDTDEAIKEACGQVSTVCRAPYGDGNSDIYEGVGKPFFMWSIDSMDWSYKDEELDYQSVMNSELFDGAIILMHDIHEASVEASKRIIPDLIAKGYKLVTLSEMAEAKGVVLQPVMYREFSDESLEAGLIPGYTGSSSLLSNAPVTY